MENCIFCKLSKKEMPCDKIYEDKSFLVFLDIKPVSDGHTLLIPKRHVTWMQDADDKIVGQIFILAKKIMLALKKALGCDYVQVSVVGNEIPHFHVHLIPRFFGDKLRNFPTKTYEQKKSEKILRKIATAIA